MKKTLLLIFSSTVLFLILSSAVKAEAPELPELEKLRLTVLVREFEVAEARAQLAQQNVQQARERVVERVQRLESAAPEGYRFDLQSLAYVPKAEK